MKNDSDSDDDNIFGFSLGDNLVIEEEEETDNNGDIDINTNSLFGNVVNALICDDIEYLTNILEDMKITTSIQTIVECSKNILLGEYSLAASKIEIPEFNFSTLFNTLKAANNFNPIDTIRTSIITFIAEGDGKSVKQERAMRCVLIGIICMSLYTQINYTGPDIVKEDLIILEKLGFISISKLYDNPYLKSNAEREREKVDELNNSNNNNNNNNNNTDDANSAIKQRKYEALSCLECDGYYPYGAKDCEYPELLLFARCLFSTLVNPLRRSWREGVYLDEKGVVSSSESSGDLRECQVNVAVRYLAANIRDNENNISGLAALHWFHARAALLHLRVLSHSIPGVEALPTLWKECKEAFQEAINGYDKSINDNNVNNHADDDVNLWTARVHLEWGLAQHFFEQGDLGKKCYNTAQKRAGLKVELRSALGKRTKYQQKEYAQLFVAATSGLLPISSSIDTSTSIEANINSNDQKPKQAVVNEKEEKTEIGNEDDGKEGDNDDNPTFEYGGSMARTIMTNDGSTESAALREVSLESAAKAVGMDNILYEDGPILSEDRNKESTWKDGTLHPLDQCIILALCLDVQNSQARDELTQHEMYPYVLKVLNQALNWMVYSTGLLERSWLEYERSKTMDRALMQIQALLDQHSSRLSIFQATIEAVETAAPVQDRIKYLSCLVYPARHELKRDLARRYLQCQIFASALELFKELEMWDEVITCYQLMSKPYKAEQVVRQELKRLETPQMLTILGELTAEEEPLEKAWVLSQHRYARARRSLARIAFDKGKLKLGCDYLRDALRIQPLNSSAWYLLGVNCMRLDDLDEALVAFQRCIQQDTEIGEAWGNIGAIYMHRSKPLHALSALEEAFKHKRQSWTVLENILTCCMQANHHRRAVQCMQHLLELRLKNKSEKDYYPEQLRLIVGAIARSSFEDDDNDNNDNNDNDDKEKVNDKDNHYEIDGGDSEGKRRAKQALIQAIESLLQNISSNLDPDAEFWDISAVFSDITSDGNESFSNGFVDSKLKQIRVYKRNPRWMGCADSIQKVSLCLQHIAGAFSRFNVLLQSTHQEVIKDVTTVTRRLNDTKGVAQTCVDEVKQAVKDAESSMAMILKDQLKELEELNNLLLSVKFEYNN